MSEVEELLQKDPKTIMRSIIQRIATGPDMSKDISQAEARAGMRAVLDNAVDPVQAAVFLIALRMKRETDEENRGILDAIRDISTSVVAPVDEVLDLSDPYNGYNRSLPAAPFLPAVLAACGIHTVSHGVETMSPKFGITHRRVLRAAGVPVNLTVEQAAARLGLPACFHMAAPSFKDSATSCLRSRVLFFFFPFCFWAGCAGFAGFMTGA